MYAKIAALIWELGYRNRWGLLATCVIAPLSVVFLETVAPQVIQPGPVEGGVVLLYMWGLLYLSVVFAYAEFSPTSLNTGLPDHVLRLPVRSSVLAAVPLVLGVSVLFAYLFVWSRIDSLRIPWHPGLGLIVVAIAVSWIQAINWGLSRTPRFAAIALLVVTTLAALGMATVTTEPGGPVLIPRSTAWLLLVTLLVSGIGLAQLSVARVRRGQIVLGFDLLPSFRVPGFSLPGTYRNGRQAQARYEWRIFGWVLPTAAAAMAFLVFVVQFLTPEDTIEATVVIGLMFFYCACVLGLEIGKSHFRNPSFAMTGFWATRPLSSRALADAKLKLAAMSILAGTALILLPLVPAWHLAGSWDKIAGLWGQIAMREGTGGALTLALAATLLLPLLSWIFCANAMAACMTGHRVLSANFMMAVGPGFVVLAFGIYKLSQSVTVRAFIVEQAMWLGVIPIISVIALVAFLVKRFGLSRDDLLRPLPLVLAGLVFAGGMVGGQQLSVLEGHQFAVAIVLLNLAIFTALPSITAPVALRINRHRT